MNLERVKIMYRQYQGFPWQGGFPGQGGFGQQQGPGQPGLQQPTSPPPSFTPQPQPSVQGQIGIQAVDPGAIQGCLYRWTYIWLRGGEQFWFFPVFVGRRSIAGFRWYGWGWYYYGVDLRRIVQFRCY
jgi:hypothetical protein